VKLKYPPKIYIPIKEKINKNNISNKAIYANCSKDDKMTSVMTFINLSVLNNLVTLNTLIDLNTFTVLMALLKFSDPYKKYSNTEIMTNVPSKIFILFLQ
jgi:hypothetical protein